MRLTIARKIALAVIGTVVLSIGTMAWVVSQNLQRGFIAYLNEAESRDLDDVADLMARHYRQTGSLDDLRHNPRAVGELLAGGQAKDQVEPERPRPRPQRDPSRPGPPVRNSDRPPPQEPFGFGRRLSMLDETGEPLFGPHDAPTGLTRTVTVDGRAVGIVRLAPLRQIVNANASGFLRGQIRDLLWLALVLIGFSALLAVWLARQLLRPVASLRGVTQRIAQGQLEARAPVINRDELGELAQHVNAMAESLQRNEQQRRRMLADVSHELRTPLSVIRGELEALIDGIRTASPAALESLHAEVLHLNKLIDDLHQLALADTGDLHYATQRVNLAALLQTAIERYRPRAEKAGLTLLAAISKTPVNIEADAGRIGQVVANLIENSVRYTDTGGTVAVALSAEGGDAVLIIEDSAPGVPAGAHERLFERLYRVDEARSRERGGSGLGLSICRAFISAHRGDIRATRSALGGVKITVRLPLAPSSEK